MTNQFRCNATKSLLLNFQFVSDLTFVNYMSVVLRRCVKQCCLLEIPTNKYFPTFLSIEHVCLFVCVRERDSKIVQRSFTPDSMDYRICAEFTYEWHLTSGLACVWNKFSGRLISCERNIKKKKNYVDFCIWFMINLSKSMGWAKLLVFIFFFSHRQFPLLLPLKVDISNYLLARYIVANCGLTEWSFRQL